MSNSLFYKNCPVCNSSNITEVLQVKDFSVSQENFNILHCANCSARFTQNVPVKQQIGAYYQFADYISHTDTKQGFINSAYHFVRNFTIRFKRNLVKKESGLQKGNLLDIGAGTGSFAAEMQKQKWNITALEPDEVARTNALKNHALQLLPPENLFAFPQNSFNVITMWHVLEHVHELHQYVQTFSKILTQNGTIFIAVPNYTSKDAQHYKNFWAAYDVPRHLYHFSPNAMQQLMQQHGFKIKKYKPMWFDSFYVSMLSEKYKTGNKNLISAVYNGLVSNINALANYKKCSSVIYVIKRQQ